MAHIDAGFLILLAFTLFLVFSLRNAWDQWPVLVMRWERYRASTGHRPPGYFSMDEDTVEDIIDDYVTSDHETCADLFPLIGQVVHDQNQMQSDQTALQCDQSAIAAIKPNFDQSHDQTSEVLLDQQLDQHLDPVPPEVAQLATLLGIHPYRMLIQLIPLARLSQLRADGKSTVGETDLIQIGLGITPGGRSAKYAAAKQALLALRTQYQNSIMMESPQQKQSPPPWGALRVRSKYRTLTPQQAQLRADLELDTHVS